MLSLFTYVCVFSSQQCEILWISTQKFHVCCTERVTCTKSWHAHTYAKYINMLKAGFRQSGNMIRLEGQTPGFSARQTRICVPDAIPRPPCASTRARGRWCRHNGRGGGHPRKKHHVIQHEDSVPRKEHLRVQRKHTTLSEARPQVGGAATNVPQSLTARHGPNSCPVQPVVPQQQKAQPGAT